MDLGLRGKRALITGASKGIGAAIANTLADEGCDLVLIARNAAGLEKVASAIAERTERHVEIWPADVADPANVLALRDAFPDIDILVNNASAIPGGSLFEIDHQRWREAFELKVFGYVNMCREFYPVLKRNGGGVIVNVIGNGAIVKAPNYICGATGNASIYAFTQTLGAESHKDRIRVVGVSPGPIATDRLREVAKQRTEQSPDGGGLDFGRRIGEPGEVASVVAFVASERASYISGAVIHVDFGIART